jgi:uncharacterized protein YndB with AHSA1/START domain
MAELRHQIPINATPEKVYAALATQAGLRGWWTVDVAADEKVGGKRTSVLTSGRLCSG